jgi:hypothetical protein
MTRSSFKTFIKASKGDYLIAGVLASEVQDFAESNFGRRLTEREMEKTFEAFTEEGQDEKYGWIREAIDCGIKVAAESDDESDSEFGF